MAVRKEPPYQVSECGYAGFNMPVEVYFRTREDPKKVKFVYDLYLSLDGQPISNIRCEKLTFHNPPDDFCHKLLKAGGVSSFTRFPVPLFTFSGLQSSGLCKQKLQRYE